MGKALPSDLFSACFHWLGGEFDEITELQCDFGKCDFDKSYTLMLQTKRQTCTYEHMYISSSFRTNSFAPYPFSVPLIGLHTIKI